MFPESNHSGLTVQVDHKVHWTNEDVVIGKAGPCVLGNHYVSPAAHLFATSASIHANCHRLFHTNTRDHIKTQATQKRAKKLKHDDSESFVTPLPEIQT